MDSSWKPLRRVSKKATPAVCKSQVGAKKSRVGKACERCRLKKTKCDNALPCKKCRDDDVICMAPNRRREVTKRVTRGYLESLEDSNFSLTKAVRALYSMVRQGEVWTFGEPDLNQDTDMVEIQDVVEKLGCIQQPSLHVDWISRVESRLSLSADDVHCRTELEDLFRSVTSSPTTRVSNIHPVIAPFPVGKESSMMEVPSPASPCTYLPTRVPQSPLLRCSADEAPLASLRLEIPSPQFYVTQCPIINEEESPHQPLDTFQMSISVPEAIGADVFDISSFGEEASSPSSSSHSLSILPTGFDHEFSSPISDSNSQGLCHQNWFQEQEDSKVEAKAEEANGEYHDIQFWSPLTPFTNGPSTFPFSPITPWTEFFDNYHEL